MSLETEATKLVEQTLQETIRAQIAGALSRDPKALVEAVVTSAMSEKKGYGKETVFQESVNAMIRDEAKKEFKKWLDEHRPLIREAIQKRMVTEGLGFVEMVADRLVEALGTNFYVSVRLVVDDD